MRKAILFVYLLLMVTSASAKPFLRIIQPYEGADLPFVKQSFVFGSVLPATATLYINGERVTPHRNGGFLVLIPFQEGVFKIEALASDGIDIATVTRKVNVEKAEEILDEKYSTIKPLTPTTRVVVRPNDLLSLSFKGATGGKAHFKFRGRKGNYPMKEEKPGTYKTSYRIQPSDHFDGEDIVFILRRKDKRRLTKRAKARIIVQRRRTPRYVELSKDAVLLTGPGASYGYQMFFKKGSRLEVTGEMGWFLRVSLDENNHGWIKKSVAKELPTGTPAARSIARNIRVDVATNSTILELPLEYIHPHMVEQSIDPHRLSLTLYGVIPDTDRIRYKSPNTVIKEISWKRYSPGSYTLEIDTKQTLPWGYDVRYEETTLILEIRHKPDYRPTRAHPLKGLKIAIDAGHTKENHGTIGPWGNTEASVNLMVSKVAKRLFESKGAKIVMIQDGTKELTLQDRVDVAWENRADLFLSVHADACGEGQDPFELEGYSVHYYHPHISPNASFRKT